MTTTNRPHLLQLLQQVQPGISNKEVVEQSSCFVFKDKILSTFNDEVCCRIPCEIELVGAVQSAPLLAMLAKLPEDEIEIGTDIDQPGELLIKGKNRRAGIKMEAEVLLPVDLVDVPKKWIPLPPDFCEAVEVVSRCASKDADNSFRLTCVHVHTDWLEACDNYQMARFPISTGVRSPILIRATTMKAIVGAGVSEICETRSWLHFKSESGLVISLRKHYEDYPDLSQAIVLDDGTRVTLPGGLAEAVDKAVVFSKETIHSNKITVKLSKDKLVIAGEGDNGWFQEKKKISYDGEPFGFRIDPKLLIDITKKNNECTLSAHKLKVDGGKFTFVSSLYAPDEKS